jgi:uncharacterized protein YkwD
VLVLRSPLEDPLSAKRSKPKRPPAKRPGSTRRRVQAFVLVAIAFFVAAGVAANRYATSAHNFQPDSPPVQDSAVVPSPEGSAAAVPTPSASASTSPKPHQPPYTHVASAPAALRPAKPKPDPKTGAPAQTLSAEALAVQLTNAQRAQHGCSALRMDTHLRAAARAHSQDMHAKGYFDHNSQDGRTPWDRIKASGYAAASRGFAENIAMGYATAQAVVDGWMNSPGHRANILNCSLKAVGIGVEYGSGGPWWTQDFGYQ